MARTAGSLVEALREEQNPKFKNSQFMGLMRSLADKTSVVEGNDIVLATSVPDNTTASAGVKGKGKERADVISTFDQTTQVHPHSAQAGVIPGQLPSSSFYMQGQASNTAIASDVTQDPYDEVYEYFRRENEDYIAYQQAASKVTADNTRDSTQSFEWSKLQDEWDAWEANAVGVRKMSNYQFVAENPYLLGSSTRTHEIHSLFDQVGVFDADRRWR